jgi:predicted metal-binding membrane protein
MGVVSPTYLVVWSGAMAAMMLPSEVPLLRLHHATARSSARTAMLGAGYVTVWVAVGVAAMKIPFDLPLWWALGGAALYQLTPLKRRCLAVCRAPLARVLHGWRDGFGGAYRMGVENGLWCLGCCIGFTTVLVALGMTSVLWMVVIGGVVLLEKATPWPIL